MARMMLFIIIENVTMVNLKKWSIAIYMKKNYIFPGDYCYRRRRCGRRCRCRQQNSNELSNTKLIA